MATSLREALGYSSELAEFFRHLSGQHDQKTHGRKGLGDRNIALSSDEAFFEQTGVRMGSAGLSTDEAIEFRARSYDLMDDYPEVQGSLKTIVTKDNVDILPDQQLADRFLERNSNALQQTKGLTFQDLKTGDQHIVIDPIPASFQTEGWQHTLDHEFMHARMGAEFDFKDRPTRDAVANDIWNASRRSVITQDPINPAQSYISKNISSYAAGSGGEEFVAEAFAVSRKGIVEHVASRPPATGMFGISASQEMALSILEAADVAYSQATGKVLSYGKPMNRVDS